MIVYLASPESKAQVEAVKGMPVLLSFALAANKKWMFLEYVPTFSRILIDSGAYSELNSGKKVDGEKYKEWMKQWEGHADACAGLDDIRGDWKRSLSNYEKYGGFPTFHDTDPPLIAQGFARHCQG